VGALRALGVRPGAPGIAPELTGDPPGGFAVVLRGAATFRAGAFGVSAPVAVGFLAAVGFRATVRFLAAPLGVGAVSAAVVGPAFVDGRFRGGREGSVGVSGTGSGASAADCGTASWGSSPRRAGTSQG
jgi:hypothetical protein